MLIDPNFGAVMAIVYARASQHDVLPSRRRRVSNAPSPSTASGPDSGVRRHVAVSLFAVRAALMVVARKCHGHVAVTVHHAPARPRGVLPSRRRRSSLAASPSLRPGPTATAAHQASCF